MKPYVLDRALLFRAWRDGVHDATSGSPCIQSYGSARHEAMDSELADLWREALQAYHAGYNTTRSYLNAA
jgi:hypothetical protein